MDHHAAPPRAARPAADPLCAEITAPAALADVRAFLRSQGLDAPTPMHALPALAAELGVARLDVKDESTRLGLNSFKAPGGAYAVAKLALDVAAAELGRPLSFADLGSADVRDVAARLTFACATDGNHGRAVARGARLVGAKARVFVHPGVAQSRRALIERDGAEVTEVAGVYDDAVAAVRDACAANGWRLVSDMGWEGYEETPALVMRGYGVMAEEALGGLTEPPTHVFVQGGVGGLAGAVAARLICSYGAERPSLVVVEPTRAACLLESARAGRPVVLGENEPTVMALLECREPSLPAWRILATGADLYVAVEEAMAIDAARRLEQPVDGDPAIATSESGAAGLAGLVAVTADDRLRGLAGLNAGSRVLLINSECGIDRVA